MPVSFLVSDLGKWDLYEEGPKWLALTFFSDERPLRGAAGLCDWRLCGRLSRLLQSGRVSGAWGETTLYPPNSSGRRRLPFSGLVLFGLGAADRFDEARAHEAAAHMHQHMSRLGASRYALVAPGRSTGRLSARRALEIFLEEARDPAPDLVVIESLAGQKEAAELTRAR